MKEHKHLEPLLYGVHEKELIEELSEYFFELLMLDRELEVSKEYYREHARNIIDIFYEHMYGE